MSESTKSKLPSLSLDIDFHESTHTRNVRSMSTRRLVTTSTKYDDMLRSGSTHQLLNRPYSGPTVAMPSLLAPTAARPPAPPGAAASLATKETAEDTLSESGSDFSGDSFGEADGDAQADRDYLKKDLGASLHDDELDFNSGDEDGDDDLIADVKNRMKLDEAASN